MLKNVSSSNKLKAIRFFVIFAVVLASVFIASAYHLFETGATMIQSLAIPVGSTSVGETKTDPSKKTSRGPATERPVNGILDKPDLSDELLLPTGAIRTNSGFNTNVLARNDDGSSPAFSLPFTITFYGRSFTRVFVNNNGNLTFDSALSTFTPFALNTTNRSIIAPFFADVDTRNAASGVVTYGTDTIEGKRAFGANYLNVGYFNSKVDKLNSFQVLVIDRSDTGTGNFDIEFNYDNLRWETGDSSGGIGGSGGNSARIGYANGSTQAGTFYEQPGSAVNGALLDTNPTTGMIHRSINSSQIGRYVFPVRDGAVVFAPDLNLQNVSAPANVNVEIPFNLNWDVANLGSAVATGPWAERVYLSTDQQLGNDQFLGEVNYAGSIPVNGRSPENVNLTIPTGSVPFEGDYYLLIVADANSQITETREDNNLQIKPIHVIRPLPDLQVTATQADATTYTDTPLTVTWNVGNRGTLSASNWVDRVILSTDQIIGNDILTLTFPFQSSLDPNGNALRTQSFSIPRESIPNDGTYYLIFQIDGGDVVYEGNNESNNIAVRPINVKKIPIPDLVVAPGSMIAPDQAFFDQSIQVRWQVDNIGNGSTNSSNWSDWVYLASGASPSADDRVRVPVENFTYLDAGDSSVASADIRIPKGMIGQYRVIVWTDGSGGDTTPAQNRVRETNESNNWNQSRPIQINAPPLADLKTTLVQAPAETFAGGDITLNWRVENQGTGNTPVDNNSWNDQVYLSRDTTLVRNGPNADRLITTAGHVGALAVGEGYNRSTTITVPADIAGDHYVFVVADGGDSIYEFTNEDNNADYDREQPGAPMLIRATPPDLIVPATVAPATAQTQRTATVSWTVRNQGAFDATNGWTDSVYLSNDNVPSPDTDSLLATVPRAQIVPAGTEYQASAEVRIPACISGNRYIYVFTDSRKQLFEYDPNEDAEANNFSAPRPIEIVNIPSDLTVSAIVNEPSASAGQPTNVSWTVTNGGAGETFESSWIDRVYLSANSTFDPATAILVGSFTHNGGLAAGASYTSAESVSIPRNVHGDYRVFVVTDSVGGVEECTGNSNNVGQGNVAINVANSLPDLSVTEAGIVNGYVAGQNLDVQWTVANNGQVGAANQSWSDAVYFSTDQTFDSGDRQLAGEVVSGPLAVGASYQRQSSVRLPIVSPGSYFLLFVTDVNDGVYEGTSENNNARSVAVPFDVPPADLRVNSIDAPETILSGVSTPLTWTVANNGTGETLGAEWTDSIILSLDQILDPTDQTIGWKRHSGSLAANSQYVQTDSIVIPVGTSGVYYLFVKTDRNNEVAEASEDNNYLPRQVLINLPPPADLVVENVSGPINASPGEVASFSWTLRNNGQNPALGLWTDAVYLSTDPVWDVTDNLIGRETQQGPIQPGATRMSTAQITLPAVNIGQYYVIVKTDVRNRVRETNDLNNTGTSASSVNIDVQELPLGGSILTTLGVGQEKYFKTNTPAGETVRFSLDGPDGTVNELFTMFGTMPSRASYDYQYSRPGEADQETVIPSSNAGKYLNLIRMSSDTTINPTHSYSSNPMASERVAAEILPYGISSVAPAVGGNSGKLTIVIRGANFTSRLSARLVGLATINAQRVVYINESSCAATFDLLDRPTGNYGLELTKSGIRLNPDTNQYEEVTQTTNLAAAVTVEHGTSSKIESKLIIPNRVRRGTKSVPVLVSVTNEGNNDATAPWLQLSVKGGRAFGPGEQVQGSEGNDKIEFLALNTLQPSGILPPGTSTIIRFDVAPTNSDRFIRMKLKQVSDGDAVVDYERLFRFVGSRHETGTRLEFEKQNGSRWSDLLSKLNHQAEKLIQITPEIQDPRNLILSSLDQIEETNQLIVNFRKSRPSDESVSSYLNPSDDCPWKCTPPFTVCPSACEQLRIETSRLATQGLARFGLPLATKNLAHYARPSENPAATNQEINAAVTMSPMYQHRVKRSLTKHVGQYLSEFFRENDFDCEQLTDFPIAVHLDQSIGALPRLPGRGFGWTMNNSFPEVIAERGWLKNNVLFPPILEMDLWAAFQRVDIGVDPQLTAKVDTDGNKVSWQMEIPAVFYKNYNWDEDNNGPTTLCLPDLTPHPVPFDFYLLLFGQANSYHLQHDCNQPTVTYSYDYTIKISGTFETGQDCCNSSSQQSDDCCEESGGNCDCPSGNCEDEDDGDIEIVNPIDPNEKTGPRGFGEKRFVSAPQIQPFRIDFENLRTAGATAQTIRIFDNLDENIDLTSFRLGEVGIGDVTFSLPTNRAFHQARLSLGPNRNGLLVDITAGIDLVERKASWTLQAIDPLTGEPPTDPNVGLLPPNDDTGRGQGYVTYTVKPKSNVTTGTVINNTATIIFDTEEPITTNTVSNTIDADLPVSAVAALPPNSPNVFTVNWAGSDPDGGSGLRNYDVWVAANDGPYTLFRNGTDETSGEFAGEPFTTYKFYSVARDNAGNTETAPTTPDAITTTTIGNNNPVPILNGINPNSVTVGTGAFALAVTGSNFISTSTVRWNGELRPTTFVSPTQLTAAISAADVSAVGSAAVTVFNPSPGGGVSGAVVFTISPPATAADLELDVTDNRDPVSRGTAAVFRVGTLNLSEYAAENVTVNGELQAGGQIGTVRSSLGNCVISAPTTFSCAIGTIPPREELKILATIPTSENSGQIVRLTSTVISATFDPVGSNNSDSEDVSIGANLSNYGSDGYKYLQISPTEPAPTGFETRGFDDSSWQRGRAAFGDGSLSGCPPVPLTNTPWNLYSRLIVRKKVILPPNSPNLRIAMAINDDVEKVFFNGTQIGGPEIYGGCPRSDSHYFSIPAGLIVGGENIIAVQVVDRGLYSYFDMRIVGESALPESGFVSGQVITENGMPLSRAKVVLTPIDGGPSIVAVTNTFGYFSFGNVATGRSYRITPSYRSWRPLDPTQILSVYGDISELSLSMVE